jgi:hypothetical protein
MHPQGPVTRKRAMSLTYDQRSEIRMAFDEAFVAPERRRAVRVKHQVDAEIVPWKRNRPGVPFTVTIEDFSPTGVGIIHTEALPLGGEFVVKVPRPENDPLAVLLTVVRTKALEDGKFTVGLEISNVLDKSALARLVNLLGGEDARATRTHPEPRSKPAAKRRRTILLLAFALCGAVAALLMP